MKKSDLLRMCLRNLARRKFRTFLTLVGVVSGTCAVILMIAVGLGMQKSTDESLAQMGDLTQIQIYNYNSGTGATVLNDESMEKIAALDHVVAATPLYNPSYLNAAIYAGKNDRYKAETYNIMGIYPDAMQAFGYTLLEGTWDDAFSDEYSLVAGQYFAYEFTDTRKRSNNQVYYWQTDRNGNTPDPYIDIMSEKLVLRLDNGDSTKKGKEYKLNVTAVMQEDWNLGYQTSQGALMSIDAIKKIEAEYIKQNKIKTSESYGNYNQVYVKVSDIDYVEEVETAIQDMGYQTYSMESIRKPMQEQAQQIQLFLGLIAGVSLFVAALGIINTMLMSVYERTREIGIMKVVGCRVSDIRGIFLLEAGCIGLMGGIIGTLLSCAIAWAANHFGFSVNLGMSGWISSGGTSQMFLITPWLIGLALVFSTFIGLISGFIPANRAVKIPALTAIRNE